MRKIILLFLLLLIPLVSAVAPAQNPSFAEGYEIRFPAQEVLEQGQTHKFHFHVFNISDGVPIPSDNTMCYFHLYDDIGNHHLRLIAEVDTGDTDVLNEWVAEVYGGNFTNEGQYSYIFQCNSTYLGGYEFTMFEVTKSGFTLSSAQANIYVGLLAIVVFLFLVTITGITLLPAHNSRDEEGNLLSINKLKYLRAVLWAVAYALLLGLTFLASSVALAYLGNDTFGNFLFKFYRVLFIMALPSFSIWFAWIIVKMFQDKELKRMWERGIDGGKGI